jgi:diacylglycerol kinase (ATP)
MEILLSSDEQIPVCFILNGKSGGRKGKALLNSFLSYPRCYVFDINELWGMERGQCTPDILDRLMRVLRMENVRVVVGGGDGSVSFVCRLMEFLFWEYQYQKSQNMMDDSLPPIAILPIGVGNELSRCIGWSSGFSPTQSPLCCTSTVDEAEVQFVRDVRRGPVSSLDFWQVSFEPTFDSDKSNVGKSGEFPMACFFSIGFDANISYNFHVLRETTPYLTSSVVANKWWYTYYGIQELLKHNFQDSVTPYLVLSVDGEIVKLPPSIRTLQMFNIHSSADGVDFFGIPQKSNSSELQTFHQPCLHDGLLEVVGTEGVPHLLAIRSGMSHSRRIAQGKQISVTLTRPLPVQLDGEAWIQPPSTITVTFRRSVSIVLGNGPTRGVAQSTYM